jgi:glutathione synthase/RimK-type ligase-like ATP-grasp enzyme
MIRVYPYQRFSRSARALARALGGRRMAFGEIEYGIQPTDVIINWGAGKCPYPNALNPAEAVRRAANKREAFAALSTSGVSVPRYATQKQDATWTASTRTVVRHKLTGHSGEGIEIIEAGGELPYAPLYVEYIPKANEYRVHVVGGEVILTQRKARRLDVPKDQVNWSVRSHDNGFVFVRQDTNPSDTVRRAAIDAVGSFGLDFGAVDIIEQKNGKAFVLEVNTAPGMEGSTPNDYARGFRQLFESRRTLLAG